MLVLDISARELAAELPLVQRELEGLPEGWPGVGRMGKLLRFSGDRHGLELLVQAANTRLALSKDSSPTALMEPANILRLAGEHERATELFERMYRGIHERRKRAQPPGPVLPG